MMKKAILSLLGLTACLVLILAGTAWYPIDRYELDSAKQSFPLMEWVDYKKVAQEVQPPVVLQADLAKGSALLFGAEHTDDPAHHQFTALGEAFHEFAPTLVVVEGRPSVLLPLFMDPIETLGESGLLIKLAKERNLPVFSWELSREEEASLLNEMTVPRKSEVG